MARSAKSKDSSRLVRQLSVLIFSLLGIVAILSFLGLFVSLLQPHLKTECLYWLAIMARKYSFSFLSIYLVIVAGLSALHYLDKRSRKHTGAAGNHNKITWKIVAGICVAVSFHLLLIPARYVHPSGSKWISTGRAGAWEVSENIARQYLWNDIELSFLILFGGASILSLAIREYAIAVSAAIRVQQPDFRKNVEP